MWPNKVAPISARLTCGTTDCASRISAPGSQNTPKAAIPATVANSPMLRSRPGRCRLRRTVLRTFSMASIIRSSAISKVSVASASGVNRAGRSPAFNRSTAGRDQWVRGRPALSEITSVASPKDTVTSRLCASGPARHRPPLSSRAYSVNAVILGPAPPPVFTSLSRFGCKKKSALACLSRKAQAA